MLEGVGRKPGDLSTILLLQAGGGVFEKSTAVLKVIQGLGGLYYLLGSICLCIPTLIRDFIYDIVAANRYRILGTREVCRQGEKGERSLRFLS